MAEPLTVEARAAMKARASGASLAIGRLSRRIIDEDWAPIRASLADLPLVLAALDEADRRIAELREKLMQHGIHDGQCRTTYNMRKPSKDREPTCGHFIGGVQPDCTCGLNAVLLGVTP